MYIWYSPPGGRPPSKAEAQKKVEEERSRSPSLSYAVETLDGEHIGRIGFSKLNWEDRYTSFDIFIGKEYRSKGYGTDSLRALCKFGFDEMNLHRIYACCNEPNVGARRCYEKVGFVVEGRFREEYQYKGEFSDILYLGLLRSDLKEESR